MFLLVGIFLSTAVCRYDDDRIKWDDIGDLYIFLQVLSTVWITQSLVMCLLKKPTIFIAEGDGFEIEREIRTSSNEPFRF